MQERNKETISITLDKGIKKRLEDQHILNISGFFNAFALSWLKEIETGNLKDVMTRVKKEVNVRFLVEELLRESKKQ